MDTTNNQPVENNLKGVHDFMDQIGINDILENYPGDHGDYHNEQIYAVGNVSPRLEIDVQSVSSNELSPGQNNRISISDDKGHHHIAHMYYKDSQGYMHVTYDPTKDYEDQVDIVYVETAKPLNQKEHVNSIYNDDYGCVTDIEKAVDRMNAFCQENVQDVTLAVKSSEFGKYLPTNPGFADAMKEASDSEANWQQRVDEHNQKFEQQRLEYEQQKADRQARAEQRAERVKEFFSNVGDFFTGDKERD